MPVKRDVETHVETSIDWTSIDWTSFYFRNLPLKIIIYWVTDQAPETHLKDLSNFQVLKYHYSAAQWALSKKMCKLKIIQLQSMSDVTFFVYQVSIKGLLSRIVYHVSIKGLLSRIVVYGVWPWYSAQAIQQWQPCPANKKLVQGCDMQRVFFDRSIQTHYLVFKASRSESRDMGSLLDAENPCSHFEWHWVSQW